MGVRLIRVVAAVAMRPSPVPALRRGRVRKLSLSWMLSAVGSSCRCCNCVAIGSWPAAAMMFALPAQVVYFLIGSLFIPSGTTSPTPDWLYASNQ